MEKNIYSQYKNRVFKIFKNFFIIHIKDDKSIGFFRWRQILRKTTALHALRTAYLPTQPTRWEQSLPQNHEDFGYFSDMMFISKCPKTQFPEFKKKEGQFRSLNSGWNQTPQMSLFRHPSWSSDLHWEFLVGCFCVSVSFPLFSQTFFFLSFRSFIPDPANQNQGSV